MRKCLQILFLQGSCKNLTYCEASNQAIDSGSSVPLPCESRKVIPEVNHRGITFGSLIISLIALVRSTCMTENCLIHKFCNLSNPADFQS